MAPMTQNRSRGNLSRVGKPGEKNSRKKIRIILVVIFAVLAGAFLIYWFAVPSKGDILAAGYTGTPEQDRTIQEKLTGSFALEKGMIGRLAAWNELRPVLAKMPARKRETILVNSVLEFTEKTLQDLGTLAPEKKKERIELICKDAENTYAFYRRMSVSKQQKIKEIMRSPEGQGMVKRVNTALMTTLSPEDRTAIGPAVQTWHKMLTER
ncbi:MAG: hypothetical protein BWY31_00377 [Lentisphaerae bacterium ADurb.Bin242]|nr:MAG: hypothetical protein BWY31_00377 [Lentisphaerae bacterium ADurb.Bin242]